MPHAEYSRSNETNNPLLFQSALELYTTASDFVGTLQDSYTGIIEPPSTNSELIKSADRVVDEALAENPIQTQTPEIPIDPEARRRRVAELTACTPEFEAEKQLELDAIIDETRLHAPSAHDRRSIELAGNLYRWQLFGKHSDPLPDGFVITKHPHTGDTYISCDKRRSFTASCIDTADAQFEIRGLNKLMGATREHLREVHDTSDELHAIINDNPANAFLRSFDVPSQPKTTEVPLDQRQRAIEEEKLRQAVLQRHGLDATQAANIQRGDPVDMELRRAFWRLDDQTQQQREPQKQDGLMRLRDYFVDCIADEYIRVRSNNMPEYDKGTIKAVFDDSLARRDEYREIASWTHGSDRKIIKELGGDKARDQLQYELIQKTIGIAITSLIHSETPPENFADFIESVERETTAVISNTLRYNIGAIKYDVTTGHSPNLRDAIVAPSGEFVPYEELQEYHHAHPIGETAYVNESMIDRQEARTLGEVQWGQVPNQRVIQIQERDTSLPKISLETELELKLYDREFDTADPVIPGYTLVSHDDLYFGFKRDATDPYAPVNVPLPEDKRLSLAKEFRDIGLETLATRVESQPLTVEELRANIQQSSYYPKPEWDDVGATKKYPHSIANDKLERFERVVINNELHVQCTGAANFLRLSLDHIFGPGSANITSGVAIDSKTYITAARHRQTTFVHNGLSYILDATSGAASLPSNTREAPEARTTQDAPPAAPKGPIVSYQDVAHSQQENLQMARRSLESQLSNALQTPDAQALYSHVAALPEATDPVRRTLGLAMRATNGGTISKAEAIALVEFLDVYKKRAPEELRSFGLPEYSPQMLDMLVTSARTIACNIAA
ncbi:MAG TPA: hypothetical protein VHT70_01495 [Candidatus Saccharimonadales bacterium]|jgi:hypothetical protein|nr:hypothetical protein [Candidatus Saccharimonadales bacterium]